MVEREGCWWRGDNRRREEEKSEKQREGDSRKRERYVCREEHQTNSRWLVGLNAPLPGNRFNIHCVSEIALLRIASVRTEASADV